MALDMRDARIQLAFAIGTAILRFTQQRPMVIEDIIEGQAFTIGHAIAQKAAKKFKTEKELRDLAIRALDRGIAEGNAGEAPGPQLIIPGTH